MSVNVTTFTFAPYPWPQAAIRMDRSRPGESKGGGKSATHTESLPLTRTNGFRRYT